MSRRRASVSMLFDAAFRPGGGGGGSGTLGLDEAWLRAQHLPTVKLCKCIGAATREEVVGRSAFRAVKDGPKAIALKEEAKSFTVYMFDVTDEAGATWAVEKRFSEILKFKKDLVSGGDLDMVKAWDLPSKVAVKKSHRKMQDETINQRKAIVETFLSLCVSFCGGHPLVKLFFNPSAAAEQALEEGDERDDDDEGDATAAAVVGRGGGLEPEPEQQAVALSEGVPPRLTKRLSVDWEEPEPEPEQEDDSDEESSEEDQQGEESADGFGPGGGAWLLQPHLSDEGGSTFGGGGVGTVGQDSRWSVAQLIEDQTPFVPADETRQQLWIAKIYQGTLPTMAYESVHVQKLVSRQALRDREGGSNMRSLRLTSEALLVVQPPDRLRARIEYVDVINGRVDGDGFVTLTISAEGKRSFRRYQCGQAW